MEKKDEQLKQKLIDTKPEEFEYYRTNALYYPGLNDLLNDMHVLDLNNDGLNDIIFDGQSGGEPLMIAFFINEGSSFRKIFTAYQGVIKIELQNKILSKVCIQDWGCCADYLVTNSVYSFNSKMECQLVNRLKYFRDTELPEAFFDTPIKFQVKKNTDTIRLNPMIDDSSRTHYYAGDPVRGNIIGKLKSGTVGYALGEKRDTTGLVWWFAAIPDDYEILDSYFYDPENETSFKSGWISSRCVERLKTPKNPDIQATERFIISGCVKEQASQIGVSACNISVISANGNIFKTITDTGGHYSLDQVNARDSVFEIRLNKTRFFGTSSKLIFHEKPHDTIVNFEIVYMPVSGPWFPDIHFEYNSVKPEEGYLDTLAITVQYLMENPRWKIKVIGFKDSAETIDVRKERANFIFSELVKKGISENRLKIEISNDANVIKTGTLKIDYSTGDVIWTRLSEKYILSIPPGKDREDIRQLNRCVSFEIFGE
jgi:hypothetical protein